MSDPEGDDAEPRTDQPVERQPLLARVPEWVVALGAGSLLASTLVTLGATAFVGYGFATGQFFGYQPYQIGLATMQFTGATIFQAFGVYFARKRVRWLLVMLAAILGSLTFIALPFTVVALVCIGLGKYHFAQSTPSEWLRSE